MTELTYTIEQPIEQFDALLEKYVLVRGDKGDQGEQGIQGETGIGEQGVIGNTGNDGVSIINSIIDENGHLQIYYSNSTVVDAGYIAKGNDGLNGEGFKRQVSITDIPTVLELLTPCYFIASQSGTFTNFGGQVITGTGIGLLIWSGSVWSKIEIPVDLNNYSTKQENKDLYGVEIATGDYCISDSAGNIVLRITPDGLLDFAGLGTSTLSRIQAIIGSALGITNEEIPTYEIKDIAGNISFRIRPDGMTEFYQLSPTTLSRLKAALGVMPAAVVKKINGKKIAILGDSISMTTGSSGITEPSTYGGLLALNQNCTIYRDAVGDSRITTGGSAPLDFTYDARWQSLNSVFTPDIVLIFGGVNDFLQDVPLGVLGDTDKAATFYGALDYLYKNCLTRYPNTRIFHMTPLHNKYTSAGGLIPEYNGQNYLTAYVEAIEKTAGRYGVEIIDTYRNSGITCYNITTLAPTDLIHIKEDGHLMVYNTIVNAIENYL